MKVLKNIGKGFLILIGVLFFAFALFITILLLNFNDYGVTEFGDKSLILINDRIASNTYKKGNLVIATKTKVDKIAVGDEVFAYTVDKKGVATVDLGTVGQVDFAQKAISYENGSTYSEEFVIGKGTKVYEKLGTPLSIVESKWGFLFIVLVPGFLIFIYEIYALIVEIKYGEKE